MSTPENSLKLGDRVWVRVLLPIKSAGKDIAQIGDEIEAIVITNNLLESEGPFMFEEATGKGKFWIKRVEILGPVVPPYIIKTTTQDVW